MATSLLGSGPSFEEILSRHDLTEASLNKYCTQDIRNKIAVRLDDWEIVGCYLGFPLEKLLSIRRENDTEDMRKVTLLDTWDKREGKGATYLKLARVFYQRQRTDIVDLLCEKLSAMPLEDTPTCGAVDTVSCQAIDLGNLLYNKMNNLVVHFYSVAKLVQVHSSYTVDLVSWAKPSHMGRD